MTLLICAVISQTYIKQIKNHSKSVMQLILLIENIKILIEYKNMSISELFNVVCCSDNYTYLTFLDDIKKGVDDYHKTLNEVFSNKSIFLGFDNEDIEYIKGFFSTLGTSDTNGQVVNCELYKKLFEKKYSLLEKSEKSKCRCTSTLLIGVGLLISIIIA